MVDDGNVRTVELSEMRRRILGQAMSEACPKCSAPQLLEKTTKKDGTVRYCKNEDCDYKMAVGNTDLTSDTAAEARTPGGIGLDERKH
jgi:hypothetical protein